MLKARKTLRFVSAGTMQHIPAGLCDVRMDRRTAPRSTTTAATLRRRLRVPVQPVRVFDTEPDEYKVIDVTDTQRLGRAISTARRRRTRSTKRSRSSTPRTIRRSRLLVPITFDVDSTTAARLRPPPRTSLIRTTTRRRPSSVRCGRSCNCRSLLHAGSRGYVASGHVPGAVKALDTALIDSLESVIGDAQPEGLAGLAMAPVHVVHHEDRGRTIGSAACPAGAFFTGTFSRTRRARSANRGRKNAARPAATSSSTTASSSGRRQRGCSTTREVRTGPLYFCRSTASRPPPAPVARAGACTRSTTAAAVERRADDRRGSIAKIPSLQGTVDDVVLLAHHRPHAAATRDEVDPPTSSAARGCRACTELDRLPGRRGVRPPRFKLPAGRSRRVRRETASTTDSRSGCVPTTDLELRMGRANPTAVCDPALFAPGTRLAPLLLSGVGLR